MSRLKELVQADKEQSEKLTKELIEFVNAHGGFIDMRNDGNKDDCWVVYFNEEMERYEDYLVNAAAVFDNSICVLITDGDYCYFDGEKDELLESDKWHNVNGGMFWINASLVALAEVIEQYV